MSLASLLRQSVTLKRTLTESRDAIGGTEEATESSTTVMGYLEPVSGKEDEQDRNTEIGDWRLFLAADVDVQGWDRVESGGRSFDITGPPEPFFNPRTNSDHHIEVLIREVV